MSSQEAARMLTADAQDVDGQEQDARYFLENPTVKAYTRLATAGELRATGFPPGTRVYVALIGPAMRARAFLPPDARRN